MLRIKNNLFGRRKAVADHRSVLAPRGTEWKINIL